MPAANDTPRATSLASVIDALRRGLAAEVRCLRQTSARVPELPLRAGQAAGRSRAGRWLFRFETGEGAGERYLDQDAMLVAPSAAIRAVVVDVARTELVVEVGQAIALDQEWRLVFRPGMLLERLSEALERALHDPRFCAETALRSLGLRPSGIVPLAGPPVSADALNESQRRALTTVRQRDLTVIWGPPGTGKTRVIAHLIADLCRAGERVLLTSTTNAAVDNALEALRAEQAAGAPLSIHRVGAGALPAAEAAPSPQTAEQRRRLELRTTQARTCRRLIEQVGASPRQQLLGFAASSPLLRPAQLEGLFPGREDQVCALPRERLLVCLTRRLGRLEALARGYKERLGPTGKAAAGKEAIARAMVVAATLTSTYTVEALAADRFEAVVVDEASMAGLPLIFHCAGLATRRAIFVGDPRQLPPIVESSEKVVRATLGRTVFDLGGRGTIGADGSVLLDTQYRMHPAIGGLVSDLYYQGGLKSAPAVPQTVGIVAGEPFPGEPLVVVDLAGTPHHCERHGQSSRINRLSAEAAVRLATAAAQGGATVAIITPYAAQARLIRSQVMSARAAEITCATVHRFQGAEADVVIMDLVDAAPLRPGLLLNDQGPGSAARSLLNVSISRARAKLIVLADLAYFQKEGGDGPVVELLRALQQRAQVSSALSVPP